MAVNSVTVHGISSYNVAPAESTQSLQAYIELSFMKTANSVLVNSLANLDSALGTTTAVVNVLSGLQTLKNLIAIQTSGAFQVPSESNSWLTALPNTVVTVQSRQTFELFVNATITFNTHFGTVTRPTARQTTGTITRPTVYEQVYVRAASAFFNQVTQFTVSFTKTLPQSTAINQFVALANQLSADIAILQSSTPMLSTTLSHGTVTFSIDPNSLLAKAKAVLADIRGSVAGGGAGLRGIAYANNSPTAKAALVTWITDQYNKPSSNDSGKFQQDLTYAVTAAQSLNNTQTSSIQNYLYIFQQYYQTAAALINAINQIITQMANSIKQ